MREQVIAEKVDVFGFCRQVHYQDYVKHKEHIEERVFAEMGVAVFKKLKENKNYVARLEEGWAEIGEPSGFYSQEYRVKATIFELTTVKMVD